MEASNLPLQDKSPNRGGQEEAEESDEELILRQESQAQPSQRLSNAVAESDSPNTNCDSDDELILREDRNEKTVPWYGRLLRPYARLLGRYPYIVVSWVIAISLAMFLSSWFIHPPTDFGDPVAGFSSRGTPISFASITHKHVIQAIENGELFLTPSLQKRARTTQKVNQKTSPKPGTTEKPEKKIKNEYCDSIHTVPKGIAFEPISGNKLFTAEAIRDMCSIEDLYITPYLYTAYYIHRRPSFSSIISKLLSKHCSQITDSDIKSLVRVLYFSSFCNTDECTRQHCPKQFNSCENFVFYINQLFNRFSDKSFKTSFHEGSPVLRYARIELENCTNLKYFEDVLEGKNVEQGTVKVAAVNLGHETRLDLFKKYLMSDIRYFGLAMGLVLLVMMLYLKSFALMLATIINVILSINMAYFIYYFVLRISYFPFMNLMAMLILIAVGADDVFIFNDVWTQARKECLTGTHEDWMFIALRHAALSITVTSLTTAGAFFSNLVSTISTIRCFAIYSGVCLLANLLLMLTWTPAFIVLVDKIWNFTLARLPSSQVHGAIKCSSLLSNKCSKLFDLYVPYFVVKCRHVLVLLFLLLGIAGGVITFYKPGLHLPKSTYYELLHPDNKLEKWSKSVSFEFPDESLQPHEKIIARFTWGVQCIDNGDWLNPYDTGTLQFDENFDVFNEDSQLAIDQFTKATKHLDFLSNGDKSRKSLWEVIIDDGTRLCKNPLIAAAASECCKVIKFPFPKKYSNCLYKLAGIDPNLLKTLIHIEREPIFNKTNNITLISYKLNTNLNYSYSYQEMKGNYKKIKRFFDEQKKLMPKSMQSICFSGNGYQFMLYDLQCAISSGTLTSTGVSLALATVILFLTSFNILLTIYATITISLAISATLGTIVLMGWELNFLESSLVSLAAGMSVDFTIHYSVAYKLSESVDPKRRVQESFHRVGFAVAVAALTTLLSGAAVIPSQNISYSKMGIFITIVIFNSWAYATFFFQALCCIIGPKGRYCQLL